MSIDHIGIERTIAELEDVFKNFTTSDTAWNHGPRPL